jgi:hypothetical protein
VSVGARRTAGVRKARRQPLLDGDRGRTEPSVLGAQTVAVAPDLRLNCIGSHSHSHKEGGHNRAFLTSLLYGQNLITFVRVRAIYEACNRARTLCMHTYACKHPFLGAANLPERPRRKGVERAHLTEMPRVPLLTAAPLRKLPRLLRQEQAVSHDKLLYFLGGQRAHRKTVCHPLLGRGQSTI